MAQKLHQKSSRTPKSSCKNEKQRDDGGIAFAARRIQKQQRMIKDLYQSAFYPSELKAMLRIKLEGQKYTPSREPLEELVKSQGDKEFCYAALNKVSRSFAVVIQQLPEDLKDAVCIFYLVLRALDTVEDDMRIPMEKKLPLLRQFHLQSYNSSSAMPGMGDQHDYTVLLENYGKVSRVFLSLDPSFQEVISDICEKMGNGMADMAEKKVHTIADYDLYCHYVAGLVGIGLSGLFSASGVEPHQLREEKVISNAMGLFLQKTNIIRDYHEDLYADRTFWPMHVWQSYGPALDHFSKHPAAPDSLACLNELVTDALRHVPDCLRYLSLLRNKKVFRFCAIPQVMAIATLAKVYNNPAVFTGVVKIRKGLAAKLMLETNSMDDVYTYVDQFAREILRKLPSYDPNYHNTRHLLDLIFAAVDEQAGMGQWSAEQNENKLEKVS